MNVSGSSASIERFQAAILAAQKRNAPQKQEVKATRTSKIQALQETIKKAKMSKPASVSGSAYNRIYGNKSVQKTNETTPKLGLQFDVYA